MTQWLFDDDQRVSTLNQKLCQIGVHTNCRLRCACKYVDIFSGKFLQPEVLLEVITTTEEEYNGTWKSKFAPGQFNLEWKAL